MTTGSSSIGTPLMRSGAANSTALKRLPGHLDHDRRPLLDRLDTRSAIWTVRRFSLDGAIYTA
jgi:hypothetical protein